MPEQRIKPPCRPILERSEHGGVMTRNGKPQLNTLVGVCRRLSTARRRVAELEEQRDDLIRALRADGVAGSALAQQTGLSAGRVTQIAQSPDGAAKSRPRRSARAR